MAREAAARKLPAVSPRGGAAASPEARPVFGDGPPPAGEGTSIGSGRIAIIMLLGAETMFFTGLIGAYVVLRGASPTWPPIGLPRLPLAVTWANTAVLVVSCVTMALADAALRQRNPWRLERYLTLTALLGTYFITVQGS
jgi:cytochrome c oxidase subunit III